MKIDVVFSPLNFIVHTVTSDDIAVLTTLVNQVLQEEETTMATLQDIKDAMSADAAAVDAAMQRVTDDLAALKQQVTDLQTQVAAGMQSQADLDALMAGLDDVKTGLDAIAVQAEGIDSAPTP